MRSLTLDTTSFTANLINLLRLLPNTISNSIWEGNPNASFPKPSPQSSYEVRHAYITAKYVDRVLVDTLPSATTPNQLLIKSIRNGDLKGVLWALARKADPNCHDQTLPALILALLQDDKMAQTLARSDSGSSSNSIHQTTKFPFAELLVLNGADPIEPRTLPSEANGLSDSAKHYLQIKSDRMLRNVHSPPTQYTVPSKPNPTSTNSVSSHSGGTNTIGADLNRTVSKLQKRLSSGGKNFRMQD
jgi:Arf-GAP with SH3 domain, ANK repeat and PH domain-containing protein